MSLKVTHRPLFLDRCAAERGSPPGDPSWQRANRGDPPPFGADRSSVSQGDSPPLVPDRCAAERGSPPGDPSWQWANRGDPPPFGADRSSVSQGDSPPLVPDRCAAERGSPPGDPSWQQGKPRRSTTVWRTGAVSLKVTHRPLFPIVVLPSVALHQEIRAGSGQTEAIHHRLVRTGAVSLKVTHRPLFPIVVLPSVALHQEIELAAGKPRRSTTVW